MNPAAPAVRVLAERLLKEERDSSNGSNDTAGGRVCAKLGASLSKLAGTAGYRSLLSRALALAQANVPWLKEVSVLPDARLNGLDPGQPGRNKEEFVSGEVALVAHLLGLLHTFIGEPLTLQLVKEAWPAIVPRSSTDSQTL